MVKTICKGNFIEIKTTTTVIPLFMFVQIFSFEIFRVVCRHKFIFNKKLTNKSGKSFI